MLLEYYETTKTFELNLEYFGRSEKKYIFLSIVPFQRDLSRSDALCLQLPSGSNAGWKTQQRYTRHAMHFDITCAACYLVRDCVHTHQSPLFCRCRTALSVIERV